eukprot:CAMPEP_0172758534 /NCGR_PEP_ID=MMETSP1074-20121228/165915_1 /TAXON_ID=2916 /ORGANISM="Ceratium fusus, Strain PA161109" /LENGTH=86 /DNA_ID=CAMNT_0013592151 /DNA_START=743 /DNA_END=1003 /DNA_ORIENTATION=+
MNAQDCTINERRNWKKFKDIIDPLPDIFAFMGKFAHTVSMKPVIYVHESVLMVASDQVDPRRIEDLEGEKQANNIARVSPSVHKVT